MSIKPISILQITALLLSLISLSYAIYVGHRLPPTKDLTLSEVNPGAVSQHDFNNASKALKQLGFTNNQINNIRKKHHSKLKKFRSLLVNN